MEKEQQIVRNWALDRPTMAQNNLDPQRMKNLLTQEVEEAFEVLDDPEALAHELVDVVWMVLSIANMKDIDLTEEFREKAALNLVRYQAKFFQEGNYDEARAHVKATEGPIIEEFYAIPRE